MLIANDNGTVTVNNGFYEPLNGLEPTPFVHVVPIINSIRALRFLGLDTRQWLYNEEYRSYIFDINNALSLVQRRDQAKPFVVPRIPSTYRVFTREKKGVRKIAHAKEVKLANFEHDQLVAELKRKWYSKLDAVFPPNIPFPVLLFVYVDVAAPVVIGSTRASILRITSFPRVDELFSTAGEDSEQPISSSASKEKTIYQRIKFVKASAPERYQNIIYTPVSRKTFNTITVFLSDEFGSSLHFGPGATYLVLHFRRRP